MGLYGGTLTVNGRALINSAINNDKIIINKAAVGDMDNPTNTYTELGNEIWKGDISRFDQDGAESKVTFTVPADALYGSDGFTIREVGIYGYLEGVGADTLIAVAKFPESYKPSFMGEGAAKSFIISVTFLVTNGYGDKLVALIDNNIAAVSEADLAHYYDKDEIDVTISSVNDRIYNQEQNTYSRSEIEGKIVRLNQRDSYDYFVEKGNFKDLRNALQDTSVVSVYIPAGRYQYDGLSSTGTDYVDDGSDSIIKITTSKKIVGGGSAFHDGTLGSINMSGVVIDVGNVDPDHKKKYVIHVDTIDAEKSPGDAGYIKGKVQIDNLSIINFNTNYTDGGYNYVYAIYSVDGVDMSTHDVYINNINADGGVAFRGMSDSRSVYVSNVVGLMHNTENIMDVVFMNQKTTNNHMRILHQCYNISNITMSDIYSGYLEEVENIENIKIIISDDTIHLDTVDGTIYDRLILSSHNVRNISVIFPTGGNGRSFQSIFELCYNMDNVVVSNISGLISGSYTHGDDYPCVFKACYNIKNIKITITHTNSRYLLLISQSRDVSNVDGGSATFTDNVICFHDTFRVSLCDTTTTGIHFSTCDYVTLCKANLGTPATQSDLSTPETMAHAAANSF